MEPNALFFVLSLFRGAGQQFLDLAHHARIKCRRHDALLPVGTGDDGGEDSDRVIMLQGGDDVLADLLFCRFDRRHEMLQLLVVGFLDDGRHLRILFRRFVGGFL